MFANRLAVLVGLLLLGASGGGLMAQRRQHSPDKLDAVITTMRIRIGMMGDDLPYDACSVYERADQPEGMIARIPLGYRAHLDRAVDRPCEQPAPEFLPGNGRRVRIDSIAAGDSMAFVHLTITRGEWSYRERHDLRMTANRRGWGTREVHVYPGLRITPSGRVPRRN